MTNSIVLRILCVLTISFTLVSCGDKPQVKDIQVKTEYVDNDLYVSIGANLSIGNLMLPQTTLPIYMPKTWQEIGTVSMTSAIAGANYMEIDVNLSAITHLQASQVSLPNGSILPLIANNKVIVIPVGKGAELYLTLGDGVAAIGAAVPFKTFDAMGAKVGTTSLFPAFNINGILGAAGIYTSKEAGKNGFGLFADLSNVLDPIDFVDIGQTPQVPQASSMLKAARVAPRRVAPVQLDYSSIKPSSRREKRLNKELYKLNRRRARLKLH